MILIVGLGNPGKEYAKTRHNIGRLAIDKIKEINNFPDFKLLKKFNSLISKNIFKNKKTILAKPQTFMNESGKALKSLTAFLKIKPENCLIIHDDIDLPLGKIKIIKNRSSAGHKGVQSIINELKTKNFIRIRIGIKPKAEKPKNVEKFVLQKFNKKEEKIIKEIIKKTCEAIEIIIEQGQEKAMNKYNM